MILSNVELWEGFSDILVEPEDPAAGMIIKVKYSGSMQGLEDACAKVMEQMKARRYDEKLRNDGRANILTYDMLPRLPRWCITAFQRENRHREQNMQY